MIKAYINAWKQCLEWHGRTRRRDYWLYILVDSIIASVLIVLLNLPDWYKWDYESETGFYILLFIVIWGYVLLSLLPTIAITVRRLHDVNKPAWYFLIGLVPIIGNLWFFVIMSTKGTYGDNDFGPDPKGAVYYVPDPDDVI